MFGIQKLHLKIMNYCQLLVKNASKNLTTTSSTHFPGLLAKRLTKCRKTKSLTFTFHIYSSKHRAQMRYLIVAILPLRRRSPILQIGLIVSEIRKGLSIQAIKYWGIDWSILEIQNHKMDDKDCQCVIITVLSSRIKKRKKIIKSFNSFEQS